MCFYILCALAAGVVQMVSDPEASFQAVGSSGAVAGVMGGNLLLYPKAKIYVLFIFLIFFKNFSMLAWIILGFWFALQLLNGFLPSDEVPVAYWAHIGGFVAGLLLCWPLFQRCGGNNLWRAPDSHPRIQIQNISYPAHAFPKSDGNPDESPLPLLNRRA